VLSIGEKTEVFLLNTVTNDFKGHFFNIKVSFSPGNGSSTLELINRDIINYIRLQVINAQAQPENEIFHHVIDTDTQSIIISREINPFLASYSKEVNNKTAEIIDLPWNYLTLKYKQSSLPDAICLSYFWKCKTNYYECLSDMFISFLDITSQKYFAWCVVELIFIFLLRYYVRTYLIYQELSNYNSVKTLDKDSENATKLLISLFSWLIYILKYITINFQSSTSTSKFNFVSFLYDNNCFQKSSVNFHNALLIMKEDLNFFRSNSDLILVLLLVQFVLSLLQSFIEFIMSRMDLNNRREIDFKKKKA